MSALTPESIAHLTRLFDVECAALVSFDRSLPHVDTPELARMLLHIRDDHLRRATRLAAALAVKAPSPRPPQLSTEASVGDTAQTLAALEDLHRIETTVLKTWREVQAEPHLEASARTLIESYAAEEKDDFTEIERVLTSVRAAALTLGPPDRPWFLHH